MKSFLFERIALAPRLQPFPSSMRFVGRFQPLGVPCHSSLNARGGHGVFRMSSFLAECDITCMARPSHKAMLVTAAPRLLGRESAAAVGFKYFHSMDNLG